MKYLITLGKIIIILGFWGGLYLANATSIDPILADDALSITDKSAALTRIVLGLPGQIQPPETGLIDNTFNTATSPRSLESSILETRGFQESLEVAQTFNTQLNLGQLNEALVQTINEDRVNQGWDQIQVGLHMDRGAWTRATELGNYHYLSHLRPDGQDFWTLFAFEGANYRLGENLYEVYISVDDIHLSTWANNPDVFASYLYEAMPTITEQDIYQPFYSQYLAVYAAPTDYSNGEKAYVRLVVVLVMDRE